MESEKTRHARCFFSVIEKEDNMVSIRDVAKHAGVAISTVSKVVNNYPNVSEETKKKVNASIKDLLKKEEK